MKKLPPHVFRSYWDAHAWLGAACGLIFYVCCVAGIFALFHRELEVWQDPVQQRDGAVEDAEALASVLQRGVTAWQPAPASWWAELPTTGHAGVPSVCHETELGERVCVAVDPTTLETVPHREAVANFLLDLHYLWHQDFEWFYPLAGLASVAFLLAIVTGVLVHLKDIVRQFHQFRPRAKLRVVWSDLHKVLGTMGLPFQLMMAFSGALLVLSPYLLVPLTAAVFAGDEHEAAAVAYGVVPPDDAESNGVLPAVVRSDVAAADAVESGDLRTALAHTLASVEHTYPGLALSFVYVEPTADPSARRLVVGGHQPHGFNRTVHATLRLRDGSVLGSVEPGAQPANVAVHHFVETLHFGDYGGVLVRVVYALLAIATGVTILTGNWLWIARRRWDGISANGERPASGRATRFLEVATVGVGAGLPLAISLLFLTSRLLPLDLDQRPRIEAIGFLVAWALAVAFAARSRTTLDAWAAMLAMSGAAFLATTVVATRWSTAGIWHDETTTIAEVLLVDQLLLSLGVACCACAYALKRNRERLLMPPRRVLRSPSVSASEDPRA